VSIQSVELIAPSVALASELPDELDPPDPEPASERDPPELEEPLRLVPELEIVPDVAPEDGAAELPSWTSFVPEAAVAQARLPAHITLSKLRRRNIRMLFGSGNREGSAQQSTGKAPGRL
jgi:hypothetical protein